jgi:hypothetical protein
MKNNRTIGILLLVLGVFLAIFLIRSYLPKGETESKSYAEWWENLKKEAVTGLTVKSGETEVALQKNGNDWQVGEVLADGEKVDELLTNLLSPTEVTVVAVTGTQHESLGVASGAAILTVKTDTTNKAVRLGKTSTSGRYVRLGDGETVYLVAKLPPGIDVVETNEWVEKTLTKIPEDKVTKLKFKAGVKETSLVRQDGKWFEEGQTTELDNSNFSAAVSTLGSMVTQGLITPEEEKNYEKEPMVVVTVERSEGGPVTLTFYKGTADSQVSSSERAGKYRVSTSILENFEIDATDLKPKPTSTTAPEPTQ